MHINTPDYSQLETIVRSLVELIQRSDHSISILLDGQELVKDDVAVIPSANVSISNVSSEASISIDDEGKIAPLFDDGGFLPVGEVNKLISAFNNLVDKVNHIEPADEYDDV